MTIFNSRKLNRRMDSGRVGRGGGGSRVDAQTSPRHRYDVAHSQFRKDAATNAFFVEQLELIKTQTYDRRFRNLKARQMVPIATDIPEDVDVVKFRSYDQVGQAQLIKSYSDDLPRADVSASETSFEVKDLGAAYGFTVPEIRRARRAQVNLEDRKAAAARRAIEIQIDRILALGDTSTGLVGLLNQPNALVYVVPNGAGGTPQWSTKTPQEIVNDLIGICEYVATQTNEVEQVTNIILPRAQFVLIKTTRFDVNSDTTIYEWFNSHYQGADDAPTVRIDQWYRLVGAGSGGTDRMLAYVKDADHLEGVIPQEFTQMPPQERNLEIVVNCTARVGGVVLYYPLSMAVGDGI